MTTINISQIRKLAPHIAASYQAAFAAANVPDILARYGISQDPLQVCHFLAQTLVESGRMQETTENLNYSAARLMAVWPSRFPNPAAAQPYANNPEKLGNFVYGGRLGNSQDGDGYKFRGRGLLQITGRGAYTKYGSQLGVPLASNPDLAFDPAYCLEIAAAEWAASGYHGQFCNDLADLDDIYGVTRAINGGLTDIDARIAALKQCKAIWLAGAPLEAAAPASVALARGIDEAQPAVAAHSEDRFAPHAYVQRASAPAAAPQPAPASDEAVPENLRRLRPISSGRKGRSARGSRERRRRGTSATCARPIARRPASRAAGKSRLSNWMADGPNPTCATSSAATICPIPTSSTFRSIRAPATSPISIRERRTIPTSKLRWTSRSRRRPTVSRPASPPTSGSTGAASSPAASPTPCVRRRRTAATFARSPGAPTKRAGNCGAPSTTITFSRWRLRRKTRPRGE